MLKVSQLSFRFQHRKLFESLSFAVEPGQLVHLQGANGVGKSTLVAIIAGFLSPTAGAITYLPDGVDEPDDDLDRREYIEFLPAEANGLFIKMDAVQNLLFWSRLRGGPQDVEKVYQALATWNLNHPLLRDQFPVEKFSTGMKRRLALARLSLSPCRFWLLDEPVYGLDTEAIGVFRTMLSEHLSGGGMGLMVSHDLTPLAGIPANALQLGQTP